MRNSASLDDLLDFLAHVGDRGLMPAATAKALVVACRSVFDVLNDAERAALPMADLDAIITRFNNRRSNDFNPSTLKEYGHRVKRAIDLFLRWRESPSDFSVRTRGTRAAQTSEQAVRSEPIAVSEPPRRVVPGLTSSTTGYQSAFSIRPGHVISIDNIPDDLTTTEAERFAQFVRLLGVRQLREAGRDEPDGEPQRKLAVVRDSALGAYPTGDIDVMLAEIERGYQS